MKYFIQTYGCQMNYSDSERIVTVLEKMGYEKTNGFQDADLIILNTCSVKQKAEDRIYGLGEIFAPLKEKNLNLKIGITGCMIREASGIRGDVKHDVLNIMPTIDFVFRIKDLMQLPEILNKLHKTEGAEGVKNLCDYFHIPPTIANLTQVFIPVSKGCNNFCSYCIVPYARGREECRPMADILDEVKKAAKRGAKEINLVGQNVSTYNAPDADPESKESHFAQLLRRIDAVEGVDRIRFYTVHPKDMTDDVIDLYGELKSMVPHIHLPIQSGSETVLKRMNRNYSPDRLRELVRKLRNRLPHMSISSDIIVGFCGETEEEFQESCDLVQELKLDLLYISKYSERKGTLASEKYEDDVPADVKKDRFFRITELMKDISHEYNQQFKGEKVKILVERIRKGYADGKTPEFKMARFKADDPKLIGKYVTIKVDKPMEWCLEGDVVA
ncbi:tRNA (N6-isopentenyl adenosine(37)-C2)-methylthiotransferase MiaB [Candidatus Peregrinibacteria bacterium]|nr:tRNA (N6-isopentenyl adenosine(37)-C2)-methylthiotransferase MiaB [Candidatus Peregrinibacteria bacterium]